MVAVMVMLEMATRTVGPRAGYYGDTVSLAGYYGVFLGYKGVRERGYKGIRDCGFTGFCRVI